MASPTVANVVEGATDKIKLETFELLLNDAEDGASSNKEMEFVSDMQAKFTAYGINTYCSEAQHRWLEQIAARAGGLHPS